MNRECGWLWAAATAAALFLSTSQAHAQELPPQCLKSFNVKDHSFSTGSATMSCRLTEKRRGDLFAQVSAMKPTGEIDGKDLARQIAALEQKLEKEEKDKNWTGLAGAVTGNFLATVGLSSCLETAGGGCAVAAIGKVLAIVGVIDSASSEAEKTKKAAELRKELGSLRASVESKKSSAKALRDQLVKEFTQLCEDVQKHCL